ncbi:putative fungal-specific transcription factor [Aspergillus steynii IBT 23096]|uniref:Putative fungal-specific transcription factor n=1 Tax=Aspergillus steynii IBT 23096 TaxID=1392250 RepID=A0A2I2GER1_9EURO|nr:putative fungal-specific transcription factor [Aspergillus steynii IBT 23096]PLB51374.1 putative fungal-specific transcription factor [Aspergillus steynii IBT 23096]
MQPHEHLHRLSRRAGRERLRNSTACETCRQRKAKCDGGRPACARCRVKGASCTYSRDFLSAKRQSKHHPSVEHTPRSLVSVAVTPPTLPATQLETPPTTEISPRTELLHKSNSADADSSNDYYSAHGRFAGEVAIAIEERTGRAGGDTTRLVPFVDAPLFGDPNLDSTADSAGLAHEMPPRSYADRLVGIYWQHVDPMEPVLDRVQFFRDYDLWYSTCGDVSNRAGRDVWLSIVNVVFALAVQRQELMPLQTRNQEGNRFFQRAWTLLRPESIIWNPGSLEIIQCLMLLNRYLHCTNSPDKTWMTAGLACRMSQNMCSRPQATLSSEDSSKDRKIRERVLAGCIALDRCVSWSLGRTAAPSMAFLPRWLDCMPSNGNESHSRGHEEDLTRAMEFNEIAHQIQLAQTETRNPLAARLGLPRPYSQDNYHSVSTQLDACLSKLENGLHPDWRSDNLQNITNRASRAEAYLFHLRLAHYRIVLLRPMLARFYPRISHPKAGQMASYIPTMDDRIVRECAESCIEAAQKLASLTAETIEPYESMGLLPWWYRVYYLHIAGTNFLAAMFTSDLFNESVSQSWQNVLSALRAHEHLSPYVSQCIKTFETLSSRILNAQYPGTNDSHPLPLNEETPCFTFDDILQDLDFQFDPFQLGIDMFENEHE